MSVCYCFYTEKRIETTCNSSVHTKTMNKEWGMKIKTHRAVTRKVKCNIYIWNKTTIKSLVFKGEEREKKVVKYVLVLYDSSTRPNVDRYPKTYMRRIFWCKIPTIVGSCCRHGAHLVIITVFACMFFSVVCLFGYNIFTFNICTRVFQNHFYSLSFSSFFFFAHSLSLTIFAIQVVALDANNVYTISSTFLFFT